MRYPLSYHKNFGRTTSKFERKKRAVMTPRSLNGVLSRLASFKSQGFDPVEILAASVRSNWIDVYPPIGGKSLEQAASLTTVCGPGFRFIDPAQAYSGPEYPSEPAA